MAQSVVPKKEKKVKAIFDKLGENLDEMSFKRAFKELYPKDWERINKVYLDHERRDKKGKGHPMPEPEKYLSNLYKVQLNKKVPG